MAASEASARLSTEAEFYTWTFPGAPIRIHLHLGVVEKLGVEISRASQSNKVEVGGILYGTADPAGTPSIEIKDFSPFPCEHVAGETFVLSESERREFDETLAARRATRPDELSVVGYYRSHIGDDFSLRSEDVAIAESILHDATDVFLLVKPLSDGSASAGFFFWDQGRLDPEFTFLEFPFDACQLTDLRVQPVSGSSGEFLGESDPEKLPVPMASTVATPLPAPPPHGQRHKLMWSSAFAMLAMAVGALGFQAYRSWAPASAISEQGAPALALDVERQGKDLRVSWNRNSWMVSRATSGVLSIHDGAAQGKELNLDQEQLRNGSVLYSPASNAVRFRFEVTTPHDGKTSETFLALSAASLDPDGAIPSKGLVADAAFHPAQPPAISQKHPAASGSRNRQRRARGHSKASVRRRKPRLASRKKTLHRSGTAKAS